MILHGNQRGGARDLALHLLKEENDHVEVHELRGFVSDDLSSALGEAYAISRGTKAKQFLYSLSLNPPPGENVSTKDFEIAVNRVEERLGLSGQPRAIIFHEKQGTDGQHRRHCHAVWSRIDAQSMKAIPLPFTKVKLRDISRELYIEHGWTMPRGFLNSMERDPRNFTLPQWQQAKRIGKDPREIKAALQDCWAISDTQNAFQQALMERGFTLARGDRRGFVALDHRCEVYSIPKWLGIRTKAVRQRITDQKALPSVDEARKKISHDMAARLQELQKMQDRAVNDRLCLIDQKRSDLVKKQTAERESLKAKQDRRQAVEVKRRQDRFNKGLRGFFDRMTGRHKRIRTQNERDMLLASQRDQKERDALVLQQMEARRMMQARMQRLHDFRQDRHQSLSEDISQYQEIEQKKRLLFEFRKRRMDRQTRSHQSHDGPKHNP